MVWTATLGVLAILTSGQTLAGEQADCAITVEFGSFASGIDRVAEREVLAYVEGQDDIDAVPVGRRGREGEYTLCLRIASSDRIAEVHRDLVALVPAQRKLAPTRVKLGAPR